MSKRVARKAARRINRGTPKSNVDRIQNSRIRKLEYKVKNSLELKNIDNNANISTLVPNTGFYTSWGFPGQGAGQGLRDGDEILIHGLEFRAQLVNATTNTTMTRVIVIQDLKNIVSGASTILDITGSVLSPLSCYQRENRNLFKVLYDKVYLTDAVRQGQVLIKFNKKFKRPKKQVFAPGTNNATSNVFKVLLISDLPTVSAPQFDMVMRLYYTG